MKEKVGHFNILYAHIKKPEKNCIRVKVRNNQLIIPKISKKKLIDMIRYADFEDEITILGFLDYLQIWKKEKLEKYAPTLSSEDWEKVPKEFYGIKKNLKIH
ncbi:MAG: hypothetical protein V3U72_02285 [Candidatus Aenigmarchaeota archaeon]